MHTDYLQHPYGAIYPEMSEAEFQTFCQDIQENGFLNPTIFLLEGQVLDGWHRYQAALTLDRLPELSFENYQGDSPFGYIHSLNGYRRHLTPAQRAVIGIRHTKMLKHGSNRYEEKVDRSDDPSTSKSVAAVAKETGTSEPTVKRAKKAVEVAPERVDEMIAGEVTPTQVIKEHEVQQAKSDMRQTVASFEYVPSVDIVEQVSELSYPVFPDKEYDILYVDPPWDYKGHNQHSLKGEPDTGGAVTHYPTLTLIELKRLDVLSITKKDALLFLWTTGPHLDQAIELGKAWGFDYKQVAFVWDKQRPNPGYYTMTSCEFVLVFKRGTRPDDRLNYPRQLVSVQRGEHSEKPDEIRTAIYTMYPEADRIELFARNETPEWDVWGNEV